MDRHRYALAFDSLLLLGGRVADLLGRTRTTERTHLDIPEPSLSPRARSAWSTACPISKPRLGLIDDLGSWPPAPPSPPASCCPASRDVIRLGPQFRAPGRRSTHGPRRFDE